MKNRKHVVVAFLLVAAMLLSVGYAALTDVLDINGTADVNQGAVEQVFDTNLYFSNAVATNPDTARVNDDNPDKASFTINSLTTAGQTASVTFTIRNANTDLDAVVTPVLSDSTKPEYFSIVSDWNGQPKTIEAGQTEEYTITVTLLQTPQETISGSFFIEMTAVSQTPVVTP